MLRIALNSLKVLFSALIIVAVPHAIGLGQTVSAQGAPHTLKVANSAKIDKPAAGSIIAIFMPKVSLALLTAAGTKDPKVEWSQNAQKFLTEEMDKSLKAKSYVTKTIDSETITEPRAIQVYKLNSTLLTSMQFHSYYMKLPTKTEFDWTIGEGASTLIASQPTDQAPLYGLFYEVEGSYASGGRIASSAIASVLGASIPLGGQYMRANLVDLKTGKIVWFHQGAVPSGTDIRTVEGAQSHIATIFEKLPL